MIAAKKIPPTIAVLVASGSTRNRDLPGSAPFSAFIANELVPKLRADYRAGMTPAETIVTGSSFGGLCSAYTALHHSDVVANVLSQSASFMFARGAFDEDLSPFVEGGWIIRDYAAAAEATDPVLPRRRPVRAQAARQQSPHARRAGRERLPRDLRRVQRRPRLRDGEARSPTVEAAREETMTPAAESERLTLAWIYCARTIEQQGGRRKERPMQLTVMTWNVENSFRPGTDAGPDSDAVDQDKLTALAHTITELGPDILAQELGAHGLPVIDYPGADLEHELRRLGIA
jgi:Putative esterase